MCPFLHYFEGSLKGSAIRRGIEIRSYFCRPSLLSEHIRYPNYVVQNAALITNECESNEPAGHDPEACINFTRYVSIMPFETFQEIQTQMLNLVTCVLNLDEGYAPGVRHQNRLGNLARAHNSSSKGQDDDEEAELIGATFFVVVIGAALI